MTARYWRRREGNVVVEFALALPILCVILAGTADLGRAVLASSSLKSAVRAGLEYAQAHPDDAVGIEAVVRTAADAPLSNVTTANTCECAGGAAGACTVTCPDGTTPGTYLRIAAARDFIVLFPAMSFALEPTLAASASIRIK